MQAKKKTKLLPMFTLTLILVIGMGLFAAPVVASAEAWPDDEYEPEEAVPDGYAYDYEHEDEYADWYPEEYYYDDMVELPDEYYDYSGANPFTPAGTGTVIDNATNEDGKEFYTIETPDGNIFYLIIDKQRSSENVYFLGAVTEEDLMSLAQPGNGKPAPDTEDVPMPLIETEPETAAVQPEPTPAPDTAQGSDDILLIVIVAVAVIGIGGAAYYFKIAKPKKDGIDYSEDYGEDYTDDDEEYDGNDEDDDNDDYEMADETDVEEGFEEDFGDTDDGYDGDAPYALGDGYGGEQIRDHVPEPAPQGNRSSRRRRKKRRRPNSGYSGH